METLLFSLFCLILFQPICSPPGGAFVANPDYRPIKKMTPTGFKLVADTYRLRRSQIEAFTCHEIHEIIRYYNTAAQQRAILLAEAHSRGVNLR